MSHDHRPRARVRAEIARLETLDPHGAMLPIDIGPMKLSTVVYTDADRAWRHLLARGQLMQACWPGEREPAVALIGRAWEGY